VKLRDSNVTTAKIADSNITTQKIADVAVTAAKYCLRSNKRIHCDNKFSKYQFSIGMGWE